MPHPPHVGLDLGRYVITGSCSDPDCRECRPQGAMDPERPSNTEPDFYSHRSADELAVDASGVDGVILLQRAAGATFCRVTEVDGGVWVEGWLERPPILPDFNPPESLVAPAEAA